MTEDHRVTPVLRLATDDEAAEVADVWLRSRKASVPAIPSPVHTDHAVRRWFAEVVLRSRETWVADAGVVVAVMVLDDGSIDQLYVDPDWTGRGLGSRLLDRAKRRFPTGLDLWTFQSNRSARRFYERHGFVAVDRTAGDNEEGAPDIRYEWTGDAPQAMPGHRRRSSAMGVDEEQPSLVSGLCDTQ